MKTYTVTVPITVLAQYTVEATTTEQAKEKAIATYDNEKYIHDVLPDSMGHYYHCESVEVADIDVYPDLIHDHPDAKKVT